MVIENVVEATVNMEPAMAPSRSLLPDSPTLVIKAPSAPRSASPIRWSTKMRPSARITAAKHKSAGMNQKLCRRRDHRLMGGSSRPGSAPR